MNTFLKILLPLVAIIVAISLIANAIELFILATIIVGVTAFGYILRSNDDSTPNNH